jgi:hypothetical protein
MANFDIKYDTTPASLKVRPRGPSIANLRTALTTFSGTSYTADRLNAMTKNDMIHACVVHSLTVAGL